VHLVQILLPLHDDKGRGFPKDKYEGVAAELTDQFGGVTTYMRTPAEGRWQPGGEPVTEEDIVVFEAMVEMLDPRWWSNYRKSLERAFGQERIVVRAQPIQLL